MRTTASLLHLDLDAFYASVEQRDKPSLRGKPVVVGGVGLRGVVATASYEARRFGVRSAMPTAEARSRCPHAAFLGGRFDVYRETSRAVMTVLRDLSPLVEPLSLDEAYVDLLASAHSDVTSPDDLAHLARALKAAVYAATGGVTGSVGIGTSKLVAKIASELDKPDGLVVVAPGTEREMLAPMQVTVIPGVGPATAQRLRHVGVTTVEDLSMLSADELSRILGHAHGASLYALARAEDDRPVVAERETKSVSVEDTFERDIVDTVLLEAIVQRHAQTVCERLRTAKLSGRTVTLKVRLHDFTTYTKSATLAGPTDRPAVVGRAARRLLADVDTSGGIRLLGVGMSSLTDWIQDDLFDDDPPSLDEPDATPLIENVDAGPADPDAGLGLGRSVGGIGGEDDPATVRRGRVWIPGADVSHAEFGPGWVWGSGLGRVTVRFETARTKPGPVRTFSSDDPGLTSRRPAAGVADA